MEAISYAKSILKNPPKEWGKSIIYNGTSSENITTYFTESFINELTNKRNWEVTVKTTNNEYTVVIDAYSGEFIDLNGPFN